MEKDEILRQIVNVCIGSQLLAGDTDTLKRLLRRKDELGYKEDPSTAYAHLCRFIAEIIPESFPLEKVIKLYRHASAFWKDTMRNELLADKDVFELLDHWLGLKVLKGRWKDKYVKEFSEESPALLILIGKGFILREYARNTGKTYYPPTPGNIRNKLDEMYTLLKQYPAHLNSTYGMTLPGIHLEWERVKAALDTDDRRCCQLYLIYTLLHSLGVLLELMPGKELHTLHRMKNDFIVNKDYEGLWQDIVNNTIYYYIHPNGEMVRVVVNRMPEQAGKGIINKRVEGLNLFADGTATHFMAEYATIRNIIEQGSLQGNRYQTFLTYTTQRAEDGRRTLDIRAKNTLLRFYLKEVDRPTTLKLSKDWNNAEMYDVITEDRYDNRWEELQMVILPNDIYAKLPDGTFCKVPKAFHPGLAGYATTDKVYYAHYKENDYLLFAPLNLLINVQEATRQGNSESGIEVVDSIRF